MSQKSICSFFRQKKMLQKSYNKQTKTRKKSRNRWKYGWKISEMEQYGRLGQKQSFDEPNVRNSQCKNLHCFRAQYFVDAMLKYSEMHTPSMSLPETYCISIQKSFAWKKRRRWDTVSKKKQYRTQGKKVEKKNGTERKFIEIRNWNQVEIKCNKMVCVSSGNESTSKFYCHRC